MSSSSFTPESIKKMREYYESTLKYLEYLQKEYQLDKKQDAQVDPDHLDNPDDPDDKVKTIISISFYQNLISKTDNLSERIDYVNRLPDFNNSRLKTKKQDLIQMIIDLEILTHIDKTTTHLKDTVNYHRHEKHHSPLEKWFNTICNGSQIILQREDQIYSLELKLDLNSLDDNTLSTTFYHYLPDNISGTLILWDMKRSSQKFGELVNIDASDEDETANYSSTDNPDSIYGYDINSRQKLDTYSFTTKFQFMEILKDINSQNYTPFHNIN